MTVTDRPRYAPDWLALREPADAAARAGELLGPLRGHLGLDRPRQDAVLVVRDLGCGTGSMGRWLAPRLGGPQHWVLHDHDAELLGLASGRMPRTGAGGGRVTVATRSGDIGRLTAAELAGTGLVTASALLDVLTRDEVDRLAAACAEAGCPALLALSVVGRVELTPADPLDGALGAAFNDHQRRLEHGRRLLGPDAVAAARELFEARGMTVLTHSSPWRLGPGESALTAEWLRGWVGAAREQRPDLAPRATAYLRRRLEACEAGELRAVVHHTDLLALPGTGRGAGRDAGATRPGEAAGPEAGAAA
ncbi:class I SAM-dependent methyltransferase [Streptomyces ficellus]|uniref:class I SAM-dependent methyltransferase n=1 Tax=Streptomyces ficellus TaxID=1977088 RepID=UPI001FCC62B6|nr:class I SAM-dependent methyltransferase [Streptomyces ficellus]